MIGVKLGQPKDLNELFFIVMVENATEYEVKFQIRFQD